MLKSKMISAFAVVVIAIISYTTTLTTDAFPANSNNMMINSGGLFSCSSRSSSLSSSLHYYNDNHHLKKKNKYYSSTIKSTAKLHATTIDVEYNDAADNANNNKSINSKNIRSDAASSILFVVKKKKEQIKNVMTRLLHSIVYMYNKLVTSLQFGTNKNKVHKLVSSLVMACSLFFVSSSALSSSSLNQYHHPTPTATTTHVVQGECKVVATTTATPTKKSDAVVLQISGGGTSSSRRAVKKTATEVVTEETKRTFREAFSDLQKFLKGPKSDTLWLLSATALITPIMKKMGASPILGFLAAGMLMGPNGFSLISGIHTTETLAELGIVFFLFEMGIELSVDRLMSMKRDVFGLGLGQFIVSALVFALSIGKLPWPATIPKLGNNALVVLGGGLALSSSAFVLQLLKDKDQLKTRFGKASFGVLLFQDLAVVPLLVVTPILAGKGSIAKAVTSAVIKAVMALGSIEFAGRFFLNPLFKMVSQAKSQEAFLGVTLLTVLSMSFLTEGLGLSNTLGAFLAGVLISETKYKYQVEADIAPFRGILLGLFFVTVGFEIDVKLIAAYPKLVAMIVFGIIGIKSIVTTGLSMAFGLSLANAQQTGLITSQGGEFAFVAFGLAKGLGILDPAMTKIMLTSVSLTMALTPFLAMLSGKIASKIEESSDSSHYLSEDREAIEIKESDDFVVVAGYGAVGKIVCDLLDEKFLKYVGLEVDPDRAIQARNKGLPVFYGDIGRPDVCEAFNIGKAKCVIITCSVPTDTNRAVINLRRLYPDLKIFARAKDARHQERLQKTFDVAAMVPILPEENILLTLPFGGAVLKSMGVPVEEVNAILEKKRKDVMSSRGLDAEEEATVLKQLGITKSESPIDGQHQDPPSPLVAQIIEANTLPSSSAMIDTKVIADGASTV